MHVYKNKEVSKEYLCTISASMPAEIYVCKEKEIILT